jgi:hydroxymethylbilane synthase
MSPVPASKTIVIGSRGSPLALWQANWVKDRLVSLGHEAHIEIIRTTGDKFADVPLASSGTKGVFIKEIEEALLEGRIDLAVHSLKDLPIEQPAGLTIAAVPKREDSHDVLVTRDGRRLGELPSGARLGTGSLRRQSQLLALRRDLKVIPVRGNVDTRLKKLDRGDYDALILAAAGLVRLGLSDRITSRFSEDEICPAVGQGALAIEAREDLAGAAEIVHNLNHEPTFCATRAERTVLKALGGGCQLPLAAYARIESANLRLLGVVAAPDGSQIIRWSSTGPMSHPESLGSLVAENLIRQGARKLLAAL